MTLDLYVSFRQLDADIEDDFLVRIGDVLEVERTEASCLYSLLQQCMDHRQSVSKTTSGFVCVVTEDTNYSLITSLNNR